MAAVSGSGKTSRGACMKSSLVLIGALLTGSRGSHVISIGVILPFDGGDLWSLQVAGPAIEFAVSSVQRWNPAGGQVAPVTLSKHVLRINVNDSRCSETWGPLSAFEMYLAGRANVFLGPVCEYAIAAVARYSPHWDIPVITPGALVLDFDNRATYRLLTRIAGSYSKLAESLVVLLRLFDWRPRTVGLLYQQLTRKRPTSRSNVGKSDCFFVMQAVHARLKALRRPPTDAASNSSSGEARAADIWYRWIEHDAVNAEEKLREMALHARSKFTLHAARRCETRRNK